MRFRTIQGWVNAERFVFLDEVFLWIWARALLVVFPWIQWRLWSQMRCVSLTDSRVQSICFTKTSLTAFMGKPSTNTLSCQTDVTTLSCWGFGMRDILVTMLVLTSLTWFKLTTCQSIFNVLLCFQSHAWTKYAIQLPHWRNVMYFIYKIYCTIIYRSNK